jgi:dTDP-4-amino-4,6-dideoxygalactose transaminase
MSHASPALAPVDHKHSVPKTKPAFPFLDLKAQFDPIKDEIISSVVKTLESQRFILGPEVEAFESEFAAAVSTSAAIGCASGSDALLLALMALNVGPGDEVITTPFTFVATVGSIVRLGAKPVFIDIAPDTYNLDPNQVEAAVTGRTRAIMPVHLFGASADLDPLMKIAERNGLSVVEDAAQAIGARYNGQAIGSIGAIGCFSFFPSKNLGGAGDGGMITTNDPSLAERLRILRTHGSRERYSYELIGMNSRLDALQAAILRVKLRYLDAWTEKRRENAARYRQLLAASGLEEHVAVPVEPANTRHVYNQFTIRVADRDALRTHLSSRGIPTEIYYPSPLHLQPAFSYLGYHTGAFPESERASREVLSLPIYPELTAEMLSAVVDAIAEFYKNA